MSNRTELTYVILAREGSKRLRYKNRRYVGDKNLTEHAITDCLGVAEADYIILGTDDPLLQYIGKDYGITVWEREEVPDDRSSMDSLKRIVQNLDDRKEWFALVQPTSPLRTTEDIKLWVDEWESLDRPSRFKASSQIGSPCGCFYIYHRKVILSAEEDIGGLHHSGLAHHCVDVDTLEDLHEAQRKAERISHQ